MSKPMSPVAKAAIAGGILGGVAAALYFIFGKSDSAKDESSTAPAPGGEAGGGGEGGGGTTTMPSGEGGGGAGGGGWGSTSNWGPWTNAAAFGSSVSSIWVHAPSEVIQGMAIAMPYYTDASLTASEEPYDDDTIKRFSELGRFIQEHGASQVITDADVAVLWLSYDEVANWYEVPASKKLEQLSAIRQALPHGTKLMLVLQVPDAYRRWEFDLDPQIGGAGDWDLMYIVNDINDREAGERFIATMYAPDDESRRRAIQNPWTPPAEEKPKKPWYWPF